MARMPRGSLDAAPLQLAVFSGDVVKVHPLPAGGRLVIGRSPECDVRIDDPAVSRRHALLEVGPPTLIHDLGRANGTFLRRTGDAADLVDTHRLHHVSNQAAAVSVGDVVILGTTMIVIRRAAAGPVPRAGGAGLVLRDPAMRALHEQAARVAQSPLAVLLLGETGVGKDVLARAIHDASARRDKPLLAINCAALSESLESELFGHEKGAFTGAVQAQPGLFESAGGGTVFLDEVGELPPSLQAKLLRVLEDRKVLRVGARAPRDVDVRFVSATNRDLEAEVARGAFRNDLFFRLSAIVLAVPPLRERVSEIAALAESFVAKVGRELDRAILPHVSPDALALLERYPWPGNVRELRNVVERAVVLCAGDTLLPEHLPNKVRDGAARQQAAPSTSPGAGTVTPTLPPPPPSPGADRMGDLRVELRELERQRILDALEQCAGNQTQAAKLLGISRRTLVTRLGELDLPRPRRPRAKA